MLLSSITCVHCVEMLELIKLSLSRSYCSISLVSPKICVKFRLNVWYATRWKYNCIKKGKGRLPSVGFRSWSGFLAVSLKVTSHKPGARLPSLSARPAVTLRTLKRVATNFAAWWTEARWAWTVCLRLLPDNALKLFVFRVSVFYTNGCRYQASFWQREREERLCINCLTQFSVYS